MTITANAVATGYPEENVLGWREYELYKGNGTTNEYYIKFRFNSLVSTSSFALVGHNLNTVGARYKLEGSTDDLIYTTLVAYEYPANDFCIAKFWTSANYRYAKITIDNDGGANFAPEIGIFFVGNYLSISKPRVPIDPNAFEDEFSSEKSGDGYHLGVVKYHSIRKTNWSFSRQTQSFVTDTWEPFLKTYRHQPFIWVWDYAGHPTEAYLMRFDNKGHNNPYQGLYRDVSFSLIGRKEE